MVKLNDLCFTRNCFFFYKTVVKLLPFKAERFKFVLENRVKIIVVNEISITMSRVIFEI